MSAPLPYGKSLGIESWKEKKPLTQPWAAAKYKDDAERIFDEEVALFSSECYSSYTIAEKRGYFLNLAYLAFPAELRETVIPEIDAIRESLVHHFELGLERVVTVRPGHQEVRHGRGGLHDRVRGWPSNWQNCIDTFTIKGLSKP